jgi:hypothetical protein
MRTLPGAPLLAAALAASLVAPGAASAQTRAKPAYKVSITVKSTTGQVGQKVTVSGKLTGPSVKGQSLKVQRSDSGGAWKTVASPKASSSGAYSSAVPLATAGKTGIRVLKTATSQASQGVSAVKKVDTFGWLNATQQPAITMGDWDATLSIGGKTYPHSASEAVDGFFQVAFNLGESCTKFRTAIGFADNGHDPGTTSATYAVTGAKGSPPQLPGVSVTHDVTGNGSLTFSFDVTGLDLLLINAQTAASNLNPAYGSPQLLCDVPRIPDAPLSWFNPVERPAGHATP